MLKRASVPFRVDSRLLLAHVRAHERNGDVRECCSVHRGDDKDKVVHGLGHVVGEDLREHDVCKKKS